MSSEIYYKSSISSYGDLFLLVITIYGNDWSGIEILENLGTCENNILNGTEGPSKWHEKRSFIVLIKTNLGFLTET